MDCSRFVLHARGSLKNLRSPQGRLRLLSDHYSAGWSHHRLIQLQILRVPKNTQERVEVRRHGKRLWLICVCWYEMGAINVRPIKYDLKICSRIITCHFENVTQFRTVETSLWCCDVIFCIRYLFIRFSESNILDKYILLLDYDDFVY